MLLPLPPSVARLHPDGGVFRDTLLRQDMHATIKFPSVGAEGKVTVILVAPPVEDVARWPVTSVIAIVYLIMLIVQRM